MFYKLLGMLVWNAGKLAMRRKYGRTYTPKPVLAGGLLVVVLGALVFANSKRSEN